MINPKLKGRIALVTGANHGIGVAAESVSAELSLLVQSIRFRP